MNSDNLQPHTTSGVFDDLLLFLLFFFTTFFFDFFFFDLLGFTSFFIDDIDSRKYFFGFMVNLFTFPLLAQFEISPSFSRDPLVSIK